METVLLVIHLLLAIGLIGVILLQKSEGGGLGIGGSSSGGGMGGLMTGRATADLLTRTTAILAALFMAVSMALAVLAARDGGGQGSILDQLDQPGRSTPAVPAQPAEPSAPIAN